jgi:hypothetical protein
MHRLPQCHRGNPQVECHNIHQVNQYDTPLSPRVFIMQDIHHVFPNLNIQSDNNKTSKGKDSIHHNKGREGRNIIWSIYINKAHDTSRSWHLKITRERDETHSYWYIPLTSRVDYSLLVMVAAGMMKMASGDDSPLRQGARTGSRLVFGGYRGVRRRSPSSRLSIGGFYIYVNFQRWNHAKGGSGGPHSIRARPRGGALVLCGHPGHLLVLPRSFLGLFPYIKNRQKVSLHLENFYFCTKNNTTVVLLKTASVRVSSNQIIPKPYRIVINMAWILHKL